MTEKQDIYHGPVQRYVPGEENMARIESLLQSDNELHQAYGEVYKAGCFVAEFEGIAAVGSIENVQILEFRLGKEIDLTQLSLGDCIELGTYPGQGSNRTERVLDGLKGFLKIKERMEDPDSLMEYSSFNENGYNVVAYMPRLSSQPQQWTIKVYREGNDEEVLRTDELHMDYEPIFGPDVSDVAALEEHVDRMMQELSD